MNHFDILVTYWGERSQDNFQCYDWLETREALTAFIKKNVSADNAKYILKVSCAMNCADKKWERKPVPEWHKNDWITVYDYGCFPVKSKKNEAEWSKHIKENKGKKGAAAKDDEEEWAGDDADDLLYTIELPVDHVEKLGKQFTSEIAKLKVPIARLKRQAKVVLSAKSVAAAPAAKRPRK
jgi:hypothetical protein